LTVETLSADSKAMQRHFDQLFREISEFKNEKKTVASRVHERLAL